MKILALDIGEKRVGFAFGDTSTKIAIPISILTTTEVLTGTPAFKSLLADYEPDQLLIGLPLSLDGMEYEQAARVRQAAARIAESTSLPLLFQDERLSSVEAKRYIRECGWTEKQMRGKIDMIAASVFLQTYLDVNVFD